MHFHFTIFFNQAHFYHKRVNAKNFWHLWLFFRNNVKHFTWSLHLYIYKCIADNDICKHLSPV